MHYVMTRDDLGEPAALSFRAAADDRQLAADIRNLEAVWGVPLGGEQIDRDDWQRAWRNIRVLANRLMNTVDDREQCEDEAFLNLLYAVGNFKRQAPIHLQVDLVPSQTSRHVNGFLLPGQLGRLDCNCVDSWQQLERSME